MLKISQSRIGLWNRCKYAYALRYVDKLRPKKKNRPLSFGTIVHSMLEAYGNGDDPFAKLAHVEKVDGARFREDPELYGPIIEDIRYIMTEYFDYWASKPLIHVRIDKRNAEHKFEVEIDDGILFVGKIDAIVTQKLRKLRWLLEHKSFNKKPSVEHRWRNLQSVAYIRVVDMLGWKPVEGTCWDYIYSKSPSRPELTAKGSKMSENTRIVTLPSVVEKFIRDHNFDRNRYKPYLDHVASNRSVYFERVFTPIKPTVVTIVFNDVVRAARDIAENAGRDRRRSIALHCDWCDFEPVCRTALNGGDVDYIIEHMFTKESEVSYDEETAIVAE